MARKPYIHGTKTHTKQFKRCFINSLIDNVRKDLIRLVDEKKIPKDWTGIELRWLIADRFALSAIHRPEYKKQLRAYHDICLTNSIP